MKFNTLLTLLEDDFVAGDGAMSSGENVELSLTDPQHPEATYVLAKDPNNLKTKNLKKKKKKKKKSDEEDISISSRDDITPSTNNA